MEPIFTPEQLALVRAYHAPIYTAALVDLIVWPLVLVAVARFLTRPLYRLAERGAARLRSPALERVWQGRGWAETVLFALLFFGLLALLSLPVDTWFGFVREREFGLSHQSLASYAFDELKGHLLLALSVVALAFGLFGLARRTRRWWWIVGIATSIALVISTAVDPYRSRLYVDHAPLPEGALRARLTALLAKAAVPFEQIVVVETSKKTVRVQAAFAGSGPTRTILLTDTLLSTMTEGEVVAAVAHEAGHVHESRWPGRVLTPLALFALLAFVEWLFRASSRQGWFGIASRGDVRILPVLVLCFDLAMTAAAPVSAAWGRERELAADRFAAQLLGASTDLESLLVKLARVNRSDPEPPRWYVLAGVTHPTVVQRLEALAALQKNATPPPTTPVTDGTSEQHAPGTTR